MLSSLRCKDTRETKVIERGGGAERERAREREIERERAREREMTKRETVRR